MSPERENLVVGCPRETFPGERRVSLVPADVRRLVDAGFVVLLQRGAGEAAGFPDDRYHLQGAQTADSREELFSKAEVILQVRAAGANPCKAQEDLARFRPGQVLIGFLEPLSAPQHVAELAERGVTAFAMELMPRTTRAQSMDALSSMATVTGYRAVLLAAVTLQKLFPMLMTAAGTLVASRVLVLGAGVAGLQAIATARRLGAVVSGYDIRPQARQQVESLGASFLELAVEADRAETEDGYARAMDEAFYRKQRQLLAKAASKQDVIICTAAVPGKPAPLLLTEEAVSQMKPGSVIVDVAAERGGNCALTKPGETVTVGGVTIVGPLNVPSGVAYHASGMYSRNVSLFLLHLASQGGMQGKEGDEIASRTLVSRNGAVVNPLAREALGLEGAQNENSHTSGAKE